MHVYRSVFRGVLIADLFLVGLIALMSLCQGFVAKELPLNGLILAGGLALGGLYPLLGLAVCEGFIQLRREMQGIRYHVRRD